MAGLAAMSALTPVPAARRAINLAWATIVITLVEGAISTTYGIHGESLSLFGFGADSLIELASALLVWWRIRALGSGGPGSQGRERIAGFIISGLLVLLAIGVSAGSIWRFIHHVQPATTIPAAIIAATSMLLMVWLWRAKSAVAHELNSQALHQDAICALGCVSMSAAVLVGSLIYACVPSLWWADSACAAAIALFIGREGWLGLSAARRGAGGCGCGHSC